MPLYTWQRYHSSIFCMLDEAKSSYWSLRSFSAPVRSGLDMSSFTCCTCCVASCACSSCTSWGRDRKCVSHNGRGGGGSACYWFSTSSWRLLRNSTSSCSDFILRSRWTQLSDASFTSCRQEVMSYCLICHFVFTTRFEKEGAGLLLFLPSAPLHLLPNTCSSTWFSPV